MDGSNYISDLFDQKTDFFDPNSDLSDENVDFTASNLVSSCQNSDLSLPTDLLDLDVMFQDEIYLKLAATYLFRIATDEVKKFNKKEFVEKISIEHNGILYGKNRLLEGMEFTQVSGMNLKNLDPLGVNTKCPVLDRYSPISYAVAQFIHHELSSHSGMETCNRLALERFHIIQGPSLFREIGTECIRCKIRRRKFLEVSMGPVGNHLLNIAPVVKLICLDQLLSMLQAPPRT